MPLFGCVRASPGRAERFQLRWNIAPPSSSASKRRRSRRHQRTALASSSATAATNSSVNSAGVSSAAPSSEQAARRMRPATRAARAAAAGCCAAPEITGSGVCEGNARTDGRSTSAMLRKPCWMASPALSLALRDQSGNRGVPGGRVPIAQRVMQGAAASASPCCWYSIQQGRTGSAQVFCPRSVSESEVALVAASRRTERGPSTSSTRIVVMCARLCRWVGWRNHRVRRSAERNRHLLGHPKPGQVARRKNGW